MYNKIRITFRNGDEIIIPENCWDNYSFQNGFFIIKLNQAWVSCYNAAEVFSFELLKD